MKILPDESLHRKLRNSFGEDHEVFSVRDKGWSGKKNDELLRLMITNDFELLLRLIVTYLTSKTWQITNNNHYTLCYK